jgi:hypothetical protein
MGSVVKCSVGKRWKRDAMEGYIWVVNWWEAKDWCNKHVCNIVAKTLETIYSNFFILCCSTYVQFWELFVLRVLLSSYMYLLYLMFICCKRMCIFLYFLCVFVILCVYWWFTLDGGLLAKSKYPEGLATSYLDTGFSWFPCVYKRMLRWFPSFQVATTGLFQDRFLP